MKIIITENQNKSLVKKLKDLTSDLGIGRAAKAVGGIDNYVRILYKGNFNNFSRDILKELIENTKKVSFHYVLFDCYVSIAMNHQYSTPRFDFIPSCFVDTMKKMYDFDDNLIELIWKPYSKYVVQTYLKEKN